jgi:hypothetical protein
VTRAGRVRGTLRLARSVTRAIARPVTSTRATTGSGGGISRARRVRAGRTWSWHLPGAVTRVPGIAPCGRHVVAWDAAVAGGRGSVFLVCGGSQRAGGVDGRGDQYVIVFGCLVGARTRPIAVPLLAVALLAVPRIRLAVRRTALRSMRVGRSAIGMAPVAPAGGTRGRVLIILIECPGVRLPLPAPPP